MTDEPFAPSQTQPWVAAWYRDGTDSLQVAVGGNAGTMELVAAARILAKRGDAVEARHPERVSSGRKAGIANVAEFGPDDVVMYVEFAPDGQPSWDVSLVRTPSAPQLWEASEVIGMMAKAKYAQHFAAQQAQQAVQAQQDERMRRKILSHTGERAN